MFDLKDHFIKALEANPDYSEAHLQLALLYHKEADDINTFKHFKAAIVSDLKEVESLENKGNDLIKKYQFQNAKNCFIKSQNKKNHCAEIYYQLSLYYLDNNKMNEYQTALENCINQSPVHAKAQRDLGKVLIIKNQYDSARLHLEKAIDLDYSDSKSHYYLAKIMIIMKDYDEAEQHLLSSLDINPKFAKSMIEIALIKLDNQNQIEAKQYYLKAKKILPSINHQKLEAIIQ